MTDQDECALCACLIRVFVTRVSDGVEVEYLCDERHPGHWTEGDRYWFEEGNMSCDCNRHLMFERVHGREPPVDEIVCGDSRYRLRITSGAAPP
jgi:hypothetical protein